MSVSSFKRGFSFRAACPAVRWFMIFNALKLKKYGRYRGQNENQKKAEPEGRTVYTLQTSKYGKIFAARCARGLIVTVVTVTNSNNKEGP